MSDVKPLKPQRDEELWFISYQWRDIISGHSGFGNEGIKTDRGEMTAQLLAMIRNGLQDALKRAHPGVMNPNVTILFFHRIQEI